MDSGELVLYFIGCVHYTNQNMPSIQGLDKLVQISYNDSIKPAYESRPWSRTSNPYASVMCFGKPVVISPMTLRYCHVTSLSKSRPIFVQSDDLKISPINYRSDVFLSN